MTIKSIKNYKFKGGERVFLRLDFNVPLKGAKIAEDFKLRQALEDINFLLSKNCSLILASHLGSPKKKDKKLSLKPVALYLSKLLSKKIALIDVAQAKTKTKNLKAGEIVLLENLRFYPGEKKNQLGFAKSLAALADIYVNSAFAVSHRDEASVSAIKKYLPSYAGLLLEKELLNLNKILKPKKPLTVVLGGEKISSKLPLINNLSKQASQILVGGALANAFFKALGYETGKSTVDKESVVVAKKLIAKFKMKGKQKKIILPLDVITSTQIKDNKALKKNLVAIKNPKEVKKGEYICDIGPRGIGDFAQYIKKAKTIIWNGPLGMFEISNFKQGTVIIARLVASRASGFAFGVAGGGETVEAINLSKMGEYMDWVSTGGGAMLSYLGGEKMPGLKGIVK